MTPHQFVAIAVRLLALIGAIHVVKVLIGQGALVIRQSDNEMLLYSVLIPAAFLMVVLVFFWVWAANVANRLVPRTAHTNYMTITAEALTRTGCGLIGLWLVVQASGDLLWYAHSAFTSTGSVSFIRSLTSEDRFNLLLLTGEVAAGFALIFCAGRFARIVLCNSVNGN